MTLTDRQKYDTVLEQVHAAKPYQRYSAVSQKDLNNNILKNEDKISRNSHRIRKLDQAYKKNYIHDLKQESGSMWSYFDYINYRSSEETHQDPHHCKFTVCDHTHDEERRQQEEARQKAKLEQEEMEILEREKASQKDKEAKEKATRDRADRERLEKERARQSEEDQEMVNNEARLSRLTSNYQRKVLRISRGLKTMLE